MQTDDLPEEVKEQIGGYSALSPEVDRVARKVLDECRTQLMMSFRFLDLALWKMPYVALGMDRTLSTDGISLYFDPRKVIERFRQNPNEMVRDYLHAILHCVFRHPFETHRKHTEAWETACDLCIESIALEMCEGRYGCPLDQQRAATVERLRDFMGSITPAKAYLALVKARNRGQFKLGAGATLADLADASGLFIRDNHDLWKLIEDKEEEQPPAPDEPGGAPSEDPGDDAKPKDPDDDNPDRSDSDAEPPEGAEPDKDQGDDAGDGDGDGPDDSDDENQPGDEGDDTGDGSGGGQDDSTQEPEDQQDQQGQQQQNVELPVVPQDASEDDDYEEGAVDASMAELEWKDIAERIEADLQTMSIKQGTESGDLVANLELSCRKQVNYRDFLRQFATVAEDMKLNDEEFDYVFYTYGMSLFGNMPLVEALEYKESERVREFVIALDTSGSTSGELVRHFVERTYDILKETESFGDEVKIHIIQCDAAVLEDATITNIDELERYLSNFEVRGLGGTDFRPVFAYVDKLIEHGEFENLRGLVYFTDGMGTYPDRAPGYDVAFVFVDNDGLTRRVPPWAMRVVMDDVRVRAL